MARRLAAGLLVLRDRKGLVGNLLSPLANLVFLAGLMAIPGTGLKSPVLPWCRSGSRACAC